MADETNDFSSRRPSTWTHQARSDVELKPAWRLDDPAINRDTVAFWRQNNLLPHGATGEQRLKELVAVGYDGGKVCAVATAFIVHVDFVNCKLAMFRNAVSPEKRRSRIGTVITTFSRELLEKWSLEHPEEAVMGMGTVTQARELESRRRAFMRSTHLGFVGWTKDGHPIRIAWFEHAEVAEMPGKTPRTDMFIDSG
jgi:hypothetical protein